MMIFAGHLDDGRLFDCYLAARQGDSLDRRSGKHLATCAVCAARYADLVACFDADRDEADAESDEAFTTRRLRHQREMILRRLEHVERPGRVISFPARDYHPRAGAPGRMAVRWLATAAAAGLLVGVVVGGRFRPSDARGSAPPMQVVGDQSASSRLASAPALLVNSPSAGTEAVDDDAFLEQLEFALERSQTRELEPFDALTPYVHDIGTSLR